MITLTYKNLRDPEFLNAFSKLVHCDTLPTKVSIRVSKVKKALDAESTFAQEEFIKLAKKFSELDEKGNFKPHQGVPGTYIVKEDLKDEWVKALLEYESATFNIEQNPILYSDLDGVKLSPADILGLECILGDEPPIVLKPRLVKNESEQLEPSA